MENIAENAKFMLDYSAPPEDADWVEMEYGELKTRKLRFRSLARHAEESIAVDSNAMDNYNAEADDACEAAQLIAESISWDEDGKESWSVTVWTAQDEDGWYYKYTDSAEKKA
jgi:hypothetical protein